MQQIYILITCYSVINPRFIFLLYLKVMVVVVEEAAAAVDLAATLTMDTTREVEVREL